MLRGALSWRGARAAGAAAAAAGCEPPTRAPGERAASPPLPVRALEAARLTVRFVVACSPLAGTPADRAGAQLVPFDGQFDDADDWDMVERDDAQAESDEQHVKPHRAASQAVSRNRDEAQARVQAQAVPPRTRAQRDTQRELRLDRSGSACGGAVFNAAEATGMVDAMAESMMSRTRCVMPHHSAGTHLVTRGADSARPRRDASSVRVLLAATAPARPPRPRRRLPRRVPTRS
jgi:hypothetical protein